MILCVKAVLWIAAHLAVSNAPHSFSQITTYLWDKVNNDLVLRIVALANSPLKKKRFGYEILFGSSFISSPPFHPVFSPNAFPSHSSVVSEDLHHLCQSPP